MDKPAENFGEIVSLHEHILEKLSHLRVLLKGFCDERGIGTDVNNLSASDVLKLVGHLKAVRQ